MHHGNIQDQGEKVELFFSCTKVDNEDSMFGKSDPQIRLFYKSGGLIGKTEFIRNNLNPVFKKPIEMFYIFEEHQYLTVKLYDIDNAEGGSDDDFIGAVDLEMAHIISAGKKGLKLRLTDKGKFQGNVLIKYEIMAKGSDNYFIDFKANNVKNIEWFSKSDPFLRIYRPSDQYISVSNPTQIPQNAWTLVKETEFYKDNLNPDFKPFEISSAKMNKNNRNCIQKLEIWDNSKRGKHTLISTGYFSIA
jgi:hypothetical protein